MGELQGALGQRWQSCTWHWHLFGKTKSYIARMLRQRQQCCSGHRLSSQCRLCDLTPKGLLAVLKSNFTKQKFMSCHGDIHEEVLIWAFQCRPPHEADIYEFMCQQMGLPFTY